MAQDPYGLGASGIPPELAQEILGIKGKRAIAEALMKQSLEPLEAPQVKGRFTVPVSPLQGIAKLTKAYMGGKGMVEADKSMAGVGEKYQKGVSEALTKAEQIRQGTPGVEYVPGVSQGLVEPKPAVPGNPQEAVKFALQNQYLQNHPYAKYMTDRLGKAEDLEAASALRKDEQAIAREENAANREALLRSQASLRPEPTPSVTEIVDPTDPKRMLRIDTRTYKGGSLGSPGVIGISGKEPSAVKREAEVEKGKTGLADTIDSLSSYYDNLERLGAVIDPSQSTLKNVWERASSSGLGQSIAGFAGTEAQTERDKIQMARAAMMAGLKQATGMSAQALNSNAELTFYMNMATDPTRSIRANRAALSHLNKKYELGLDIPGDPDEEKRLATQAPKTGLPPIKQEDSGWKDL